METSTFQINKDERNQPQILYIDGEHDLVFKEYFEGTEIRQFFDDYILEHINLKHHFLNFKGRIEKDICGCKYDLIIISPFISKKGFKHYLPFLKQNAKFVQVGLHPKKVSEKYGLHFEREYKGDNPFLLYTKFK